MFSIFKKSKNIWDEKKMSFFSLGLRYENEKTAVPYFCTPKGARIFASIGVDGVHYCTIPKFGDTVFAVTPMPGTDRYVFPIAKDKTEFLALTAALCGTQLIDQIPLFSRERFECILREHLSENCADRAEELEKLKKEFSVSPLDRDPYDLVMDLYNSFDYEKIEFTAEYHDALGL